MRKMLLAVLALAAALTAPAQQPPELRRERPDSTRLRELEYPDSMTHMRYWRPDYETMVVYWVAALPNVSWSKAPK